MVSTVMVEDYESRSAYYTVVGDEEIDEVKAIWELEDVLLCGLQETRVFSGLTRWCDLRPWHIKFLITQTLEKVYELSGNDRNDSNHPTIKSLDVLIACLIHCLETCADVRVEFLKIQRIESMVVNFDYRGSLMLEPQLSEPKPGLSLAVDNSRGP